jgi:CRP/FNR family transcriptional regulator, transcriptional activator FtrB
MRVSDFAEIRALPLFSAMGDESFEKLMRAAYVQNFPPQIELIHEGDRSDFLHVVVEGSVELLANWNGRETVMATIRPVSTFILAATLRDAPYLMSARTLGKARIVLIPSEDVRAMFDADATFARAVVAELAERYRDIVKHAKDLKLRSSIERLGNYLLRLRRLSGNGPEMILPIEKRRLAAYLNMTPENLSRAFRSLEAYGVAVDGARVRIADSADLEHLAKPSALIDDLQV